MVCFTAETARGVAAHGGVVVHISARCPFIVIRRTMAVSPSLLILAFLAMKFKEK